MLVDQTGTPITIASAPGTYWPYAGGINNSKEIVRFEQSDRGDYSWVGWHWKGGQKVFAPLPPGGDWIQLHDISDKGHIVGHFSGPNLNIKPIAGVIQFEGKSYPFSVPGETYNYVLARSINSFGDVVGYYYDQTLGVMRGFLLHMGQFYILKISDNVSDNLYPQSINDNGEVVANLRSWDATLRTYVTSMHKITLTLDHDNDGLPTKWEREGLKDEQGNVILDLPTMGADPLRKDIFVEVDHLKSGNHRHRLSKEAAEALRIAFEIAPIENPDPLKPGINLHIDAGPQYTMNKQALTPAIRWQDLSQANEIHESSLEFGPNGSFWERFNEIKDNPDYFNNVRRPVFHYVLMVHDLRNRRGEPTLGRGQNGRNGRNHCHGR